MRSTTSGSRAVGRSPSSSDPAHPGASVTVAGAPPGPRRARPRRPLRQSRWAGVVIGAVSTLVVVLVVGWVISTSAGWPRVQELFFDGDVFADSLPDIAAQLVDNLRIFA